MATRRYLLTFFLVVLSGAALFAYASAYRFWTLRDLDEGDPRLGQLLRYQEQKIARLTPNSIDTVFIGDSSLGNGIDAREFDIALGGRSVSLALTGNFGFGGGLALLTQVGERQPIRNVILFYSIDAMATGAAPEGYFFASPRLFVEGLSWRDGIGLVRAYASMLLNGHSALILARKLMHGDGLAQPELPEDLYANDYVISRAQIDLAGLSYEVPRSVNPGSTIYLSAIARLCAVRGWNCVYAHGPVLARSLDASVHAGAYLAEAQRVIGALGLQVVTASPVTLADAERGDTRLSHPHRRSRRNHEKVRRHLARLHPSGPQSAPAGARQERALTRCRRVLSVADRFHRR